MNVPCQPSPRRDGAPQRRLGARPPTQIGMRRSGVGLHLQVLQPHGAARVVHRLLTPAGAHGLDGLVGAQAALVERHVERLELLSSQPAAAPTMRRPPLSRSSDASSLARCSGWRYGSTRTLVPRPTRCGRRRRPRQRDHRLEQERRRVGRVARDGEVVAHPHVGEAELLGMASATRAMASAPAARAVLREGGSQSASAFDANYCRPMPLFSFEGRAPTRRSRPRSSLRPQRSSATSPSRRARPSGTTR